MSFVSMLQCRPLAVLIVMLVSWAPGAQAASKAKVFVKKTSSGRLYVPPSIISGSLVTKGRVFYSPTLPENTLAGVRLGRPAREVLARWGNPTRITLGSVRGEAASAQSSPGIPYLPPARTGESIGVEQLLSGLPGLPGFGPPGSAQPPGAAPPSTGSESPALRQEEVTYTYDLPNGITLEFIITEGIVTQITVGGIGPWSGSKTRMGLQLGDSYKLVVWVCGYPESQKFVGRFLRMSYVDKCKTLFTLDNKRIVGITIALVPQELAQK